MEFLSIWVDEQLSWKSIYLDDSSMFHTLDIKQDIVSYDLT